jgi:hypothetical protein
MALGRISGPLLKANLERLGVDLAFETDLLYLDVNNQRIGVRTNTPQYDLDVNGTINSTNLEVSTLANIADITVSGNTIETTSAVLNLATSNTVVYQNKLRIDSIDIDTNVITTTESNADLILRANGSGKIVIPANDLLIEEDLTVNGTANLKDTTVTGNLTVADLSVSGDFTTTGDITNNNILIKDNFITTTDSNSDLELRASGTGEIYIPDNNVQVNNNLTVSGLATTNSITASGDIDVTGNVSVSNDLDVSKNAQFENIRIVQNTISTSISNSNLELSPNGVGTVEISANTNITGNLHATGTITADGDITIGDADTDNITINAEVASDIIPDQDNTYELGSPTKRWANIWSNNLITDSIETNTIDVGGIDLALSQGNIYYVAENGSDAASGTHQNNPRRTVKSALGSAGNGDTVLVYPGVYEEAFPITVPKGVTLKGYGIRAVNIKPTTATRYNDAFLVNGESTVEDLTVRDFYSGGNFFRVTNIPDTSTIKVNVGTSPFAHAYVSGGTIDSDDSTIANVTGATYDHTTGELTITTDVPHDTYIGANLFLKDLTFSCNGGTRVFPDNGYAFRFATDFEVTTRSPYIRNITVLTFGSTSDVSDPRGYNAGDAGKGAYIDGAYATAASKEASMLFHSATFICPGVDAVTATNGARIEWLNSFTYFANKSFNAFDSNDGLKGAGQTALRVDGLSGSFAASETVSYYDTDGVTLLASGTIADKDADGKFYIDGKVVGFETATERGGKTIAANGDAQLSTSIKKMGTASLLLDGTGDYASITSQADFGFGTGNFTVEGWMYLDATSGVQTFTDFRAGVDTNTAVWIYADGADAKVNVGNSTVITGTTALSATTWHHIALTRSGTDTKLFVDGVQVGSTYTDSNDYGNTKPVYIGAEHDAGGALDGNIDDVRIIKGNAVYTAGFTPTNLPLTVTSQTVLMARFDGDNASTTFEDNVVLAQDIRFSGGATATGITLADYTDFGAEIRSISSASVYGKYGLYGDGPGVLMYAIGHNLAYIGTEEFEDNEPTAVIQENEVVELNGARIRYTSVDHQGDFRVGNLFYVDQQTGTITFSSANFQVQSTSGLTFTDGGNTTFIDGTTVDTGNISIHDNTIETTSGDLNITAASGEINLQDDVSVTGNVDVTGNVTVGGNITIGDQTTDELTIIAEVTSNIVPDTPSTYDLGTESKTWNTLYASNVQVDDIEINDNYITTTASNADLELRANGTGTVYVPANNVQVDADLTVNGTSSLSTTNITGTVTVTGNTVQTGNVALTGNETITGTITTSGRAQFENIQINDNYITTTESSSNLELRANGTGQILIPNNDVVISNTLTVNGNSFFQAVNSTGTITANSFTTGDITLNDNTISTTLSNSNLELVANGTGSIYVPNNNVQLDNNLTVNGVTNLANTNITGTITHVGNYTQTGNIQVTGGVSISQTLNVSGNAQFENIQINDNYITTTESNSDLELRASGTGEIIIPSNNVVFDNNITVNGVATVNDINSTGTITANSFSTGDILIDDNFITTTLSNSNLELRANGVGVIYVPNNNVLIDNNLTVTGITNLLDTEIIGTVIQTGNTTQTGDIALTGDLAITQNFTVSSTAQFENIQINDNYITTTESNSDLELRANGTGEVIVSNNNVVFDQNVTVNGVATINDINSTGTITANSFSTGDILIDDNFIATTLSNSDLELRANGTGTIYVPLNNVDVDNNLTVAGTTTLADTTIIGTVTQTGNTTQTGDVNLTGNLVVTQNFTVSSTAQFENIQINDNYITTTESNSDLELRANGTGMVRIPSNDVTFEQDITISGTATINDINSTGTITANSFSTGDILIDDNFITTTLSNSDLELRANGTGSIVVDNISIKDNVISSDSDLILTSNTDIVEVTGTGAVRLPRGTELERPGTPETGMIRYNQDSDTFEGYTGTAWTRIGQGVIDLDGNTKITAELTPGANDNIIRFYTNGTLVADIDADRFRADKLVVDDIQIDSNVISTITANTDLELTPNGTGAVVFENFEVSDSTLTNTTANAITVFESTSNGYIKIADTSGFVLPVGDSTNRPSVLYRETGMMRYNSSEQRVEIFDGANWVSVAGSASGISRAEAENIAIETVLIFG